MSWLRNKQELEGKDRAHWAVFGDKEIPFLHHNKISNLLHGRSCSVKKEKTKVGSPLSLIAYYSFPQAIHSSTANTYVFVLDRKWKEEEVEGEEEQGTGRHGL